MKQTAHKAQMESQHEEERIGMRQHSKMSIFFRLLKTRNVGEESCIVKENSYLLSKDNILAQDGTIGPQGVTQIIRRSNEEKHVHGQNKRSKCTKVLKITL